MNGIQDCRRLSDRTDAGLNELHRRLVVSPESFYSQVALLSRRSLFGLWLMNGWASDMEHTEKRVALDKISREIGPTS